MDHSSVIITDPQNGNGFVINHFWFVKSNNRNGYHGLRNGKFVLGVTIFFFGTELRVLLYN